MRSGKTTLLSVSLLMFTCSVVFMPVTQVYAWDGFSGFKKFGEDIFEQIASIDPNYQQQVIVKNLADWQVEKEQMIQQGMPVPQELENVIAEKNQKLDEIHNTSSNVLSGIVDTIQQGQELHIITLSLLGDVDQRLKRLETPNDRRTD